MAIADDTGGVARRTVLTAATAVAGAAVLAACGSEKSGGSAITTTTAKHSAGDARLLRTASSLEELLVALYDQALASGVLSAAGAELFTLFKAQHKNHALLFEGATTKTATAPMTQPNPVLLGAYQARVAAATSEAELFRAAYDFEQVAAATYQAAVAGVDDAELNVPLMSVGGVEARHAAVLAARIGLPAVPPSGFATTAGAIAPGTGV